MMSKTQVMPFPFVHNKSFREPKFDLLYLYLVHHLSMSLHTEYTVQVTPSLSLPSVYHRISIHMHKYSRSKFTKHNIYTYSIHILMILYDHICSTINDLNAWSVFPLLTSYPTTTSYQDTTTQLCQFAGGHSSLWRGKCITHRIMDPFGGVLSPLASMSSKLTGRDLQRSCLLKSGS